MGQCIVDGWLKHQIFSAEQIVITDAYLPSIEALKRKYPGCQVLSDNGAAVQSADLVVLCVKPFMVESVLQSLAPYLRGKVLLSIAAGIKLSVYHHILSGAAPKAIIRAMPNIACRVDKGMTVVCDSNAAEKIAALDRPAVLATEALFQPLGGWLCIDDEKLMDVVTALNGSALAFGLQAIEAMADGAVKAGLMRPMALSLSAHALLAAGSLAVEPDAPHPAVLRDQITTPGGCTIAGLLTLEEGNFRSTLAKAVLETTRVSKELGQK